VNRYQRRVYRQHKRATELAGLTTGCLEDVTEKAEQLEVVRLYRTAGCEVYSLSQPRATMQSPGFGDLYVFCERKGLAWWFETKRPKGGRQSEAQKKFQELCQRCGIGYVIGGFDEAHDHLRKIGVVAE